MSHTGAHEAVSAIAARVAAGNGLELVEVEIKRQRKKALVCVYLDRPGGVGLEELQSASREIAAILEVEDPVEGGYTLEVSSPGLDRPLRSEADFRRAVGRLVRLTTTDAEEEASKRPLSGRLVAVADGAVRLELAAGGEVAVPLGRIEQGRIQVEFK